MVEPSGGVSTAVTRPMISVPPIRLKISLSEPSGSVISTVSVERHERRRRGALGPGVGEILRAEAEDDVRPAWGA